LANGMSITVVFVVPTRTTEGQLVSLASRTHKATVAEDRPCAMGSDPCSLHLHVKTGDSDADLATWIADASDAVSTTIIGPTSDWTPAPSP
jgi:hypothetical protein